MSLTQFKTLFVFVVNQHTLGNVFKEEISFKCQAVIGGLCKRVEKGPYRTITPPFSRIS